MSFIQSKNVPNLKPVTVEVAAGTQRILSIPDNFFGKAIAMFIRNNGTGVATYRTNGETQPLISLAAGATDTEDLTDIQLIEVNAHATGTVTLKFQVLAF